MLAALLLEAAAEGVMGVVVHRIELEHLAELRLRLFPAANAEVRDPQRLSNRRLLRLAPLRLLECNRRLRRHAALQMRTSLLEQVIGGFAHDPRYGKFSRITSTGCVRSRVFP